jgi:hypothetical protein
VTAFAASDFGRAFPGNNRGVAPGDLSTVLPNLGRFTSDDLGIT